MLSGITPFVFSADSPPTDPKGLLMAEKIAENTPTTAADTPTVIATFVGLGTQTSCRMFDVDGGVVVGVGLEVGLAVGLEEAVGLGDEDAAEESDMTETVPSALFVTNTSPLPES